MILFFKRHLWIAILILSLILIPQSVNIQSELNMRALMTIIGLDKTENNEYKVSIAMVKPSRGSTGPSANVRMEIVGGEGKTIADAVSKVSFSIGKTAGFSHVNTVILGKNIIEDEDNVKILDYFIRDNRIPTSSMVLIAEDKAEDTLKTLNKLELSTAVDLQKLFLYKESSLNGLMMTIQNFADEYYQPSECGILSEIKFIEESFESGSGSSGSGGSAEGGSGSGGSSGGGAQESGSGDSESPKIEYNNNIYMFNHGKLAGELKADKSIMGVNLTNTRSRNGMIIIEGVNDEIYKNADVSIYIRDKKVKYKVKYENGVPQCTLTITTKKNEVFEIKNEGEEAINLLYSQKTYLTQALIDKAKEYIKDCVMQAFNEAKEQNVDVFTLGTKAYRKDYKKWETFSKGLSHKEYLDKMEFKVEVDIKNQL